MYVNDVAPSITAPNIIKESLEKIAEVVKMIHGIMIAKPQYLYVSTTYELYVVRYDKKTADTEGEIHLFPLLYGTDFLITMPRSIPLKANDNPTNLKEVMDLITYNLNRQIADYSLYKTEIYTSAEGHVKDANDAYDRLHRATKFSNYIPYAAVELFEEE